MAQIIGIFNTFRYFSRLIWPGLHHFRAMLTYQSVMPLCWAMRYDTFASLKKQAEQNWTFEPATIEHRASTDVYSEFQT
jgi:hypothetical protein